MSEVQKFNRQVSGTKLNENAQLQRLLNQISLLRLDVAWQVRE